MNVFGIGRRYILALVIIPLAAACGSATGNDQRAEPAIAVRPITSSAQLDLPLARYAFSEADERAYFAAVNIAQAQCAADFGVKSTMPPAEPNLLMEEDTVRRYGLLNAEEVARYGYRLPPSADEGSDKSAGWNPDGRERLVMTATDLDGTAVETDPETDRALPAQGCAAEGFRIVSGKNASPARNDLASDLMIEAWNLTLADSRAADATAKWSTCMAEHGYEFDQRWEAGNSVGGKPAKTQLAMAELDLGCALDTGYVDVWYAVDVAYQERLIAEHDGELHAISEEQQKVMETARKLLREGS